MPVLYYVDPLYRLVVWVFVAFFGAALGSFSSAISYRTARGESWIKADKGNGAARSRCPGCCHTLGFFDLIPIFSWVFLGGKCRYCQVMVPIRYPLLEAMSAALLLGFFIYKGDKISLYYTLIFAVVLPFFMSFWGAVLERKPAGFQMPQIKLYLYGALSGIVMLKLLCISTG